MSIQGLEQWLHTPAGQYVLEWEQRTHDALVADIFGFNAVQLSLPAHDLLRSNRMPLRLYSDDVRAEGRVDVFSDVHHLPFASNSIDLVVVPHTLEFDSNPHQVLREVERVLVPEGQVLVSGFNPMSLWGTRRRLGRTALPPWRGKYIALWRLKEWLSLLGLEYQTSVLGCYAPPFANEQWLRRSAFMDRWGANAWPFMGAAYVVQAVKRQHGLRLITPKWHDRKAQAKAAVSLSPTTRTQRNTEK
ncbi:MAG: class I SAM-dependent methyltransferase [Rhodocyclaceae bacterium]|jgi:SAM-dependent methyltransferase|nr:class I SAM-dependent methyltransferase [Rhodocyclaceae bacterium]MBK6907502.1 class I SAM-dependent methyltransferase [Rhodocyclaceae bacterium]